MVEVIAQSFGIIAMALAIVSYQSKSPKKLFIMQIIATICFAVNFLLLGGYMGFMLNLVATARATIFLFREKLKADHFMWLVALFSTYFICYALAFTAFGVEFNLKNALVEFAPVVGMIAITIGYRTNTTRSIRLAGLINEPAWLICAISSFSIGGIICNAVSLVSIIIGLFRLDKSNNSQVSSDRLARPRHGHSRKLLGKA